MKSVPPIKLLYIATFPPPEGGQRLIFYYFYQDLLNRYGHILDITPVDLSAKTVSRFYYGHLLGRFVKAIWGVFKSDVVVFQAPYNYMHLFGPWLYLATRIAGKPLMTRRSAGNNIELYQKQPRWFRTILNTTILNAELSCFETRYEVDYFQKISKNRVMFVSNNRPMRQQHWQPLNRNPVEFIFVGDIGERKGAFHLIHVFQQLTREYPVRLTLYGRDLLNIASRQIPGIRYGGIIPNKKIPEVISRADVLVLPSYQEGIPGVIIEAFMMNKPVITTRLPSIMQIVEHNKTGLLIDPGNEDQLARAIVRIHKDPDLYNQLSRNISEIKHQLSTEYWTDILVKEIQQLVRQ